jgi:hypothetical protein
MRYDPPRRKPPFDQRQREFAAALLNPELPIPAGLRGPDGEAGAKRFNVYRNNIVAGLCEALQAAFPATHRIVGDAFFAAMSRVYVSREPPRSPVMLRYGAGFADFIGSFEPAAAVPYLRDVARLERAWAEAWHAAEATPLDASALTHIAPEQFCDMRVVLHPSVRVVRSRFPVVSIWQMNIDDGVPRAIDLDANGEDALIARPCAEVEVRTLAPGAAAFIEALEEDASAVDATTIALADDTAFDLSGTLSILIAAGAIVALKAPRGRS